jgi:hypothetical protein
MTNWEKFHKGIHQTALYDPNDLSIEGLLKDMTNEPTTITHSNARY